MAETRVALVTGANRGIGLEIGAEPHEIVVANAVVGIFKRTADDVTTAPTFNVRDQRLRPDADRNLARAEIGRAR